MAGEKSNGWIVGLIVGLLLCAGIGLIAVPFIFGFSLFALRSTDVPQPPQVIWTTDADGCPDTCRRAGECHLETFLGEACVASCESGLEVYKCIKTARSCSDMERCK